MSTPSSKEPLGSRITTGRYLVLYNAVSAFLWFSILVRTITIALLGGTDHVYEEVGQITRWVQTLALLEVVHSITGLVRSPLFTTLLQVASRLMLVHPILAYHPQITSAPYVTTMYIAWSVTEVIRYSYFAQNLRGTPPDFLIWLRYNTFFVLYPVGIASECALIWKASLVNKSEYATIAMWAVLLAYVPGAYVLYTHMMTQRRRVKKGKAVVKQGRRGRVPTI